jgi:hypothetical protein
MDSSYEATYPGISASVMVVAASSGNQPPTLTSTPAQTQYTEGGAPVSLFSNTTISTVEADQTLIALELQVSGLANGSDEILVVDGTSIRLVQGSSGSTLSGYVYQVSISDGMASVSLSLGSQGLGADATAALVNGIAYANLSDAPSGSTRSISLSLLQDSGGTANNGQDRSVPAITASVELQAVNDAPTASAAPASLPDGYLSESYWVTLPISWFIDADGDALSWQVDGLPQGLSFEPGTRTISGTTTTEPGRYSLSVTVSDSSGASATRTLELNIQPLRPHIDADSGRYEAGLEQAVEASTAPAATPVAAPDTLQAELPSLAEQIKANQTAIPAATALLDALLSSAWQNSEATAAEVVFSDGQSSPLVTLAPADGPALLARQSTVSGAWAYDAAAHRMVFQLPEGLLSSRIPVAELTLQMADGRALPDGVQLDLGNGRILAPSGRAESLDLQLTLRSADGQVLTIQIHLAAPPAAAPSAAASTETANALESAVKPALSEQLRLGPARDLLADAHALLSQLAAGAEVEIHHHQPYPLSPDRPDLAAQSLSLS